MRVAIYRGGPLYNKVNSSFFLSVSKVCASLICSGVSVQGVSIQGVYVLGVSIQGVYVPGGPSIWCKCLGVRCPVG